MISCVLVWIVPPSHTNTHMFTIAYIHMHIDNPFHTLASIYSLTHVYYNLTYNEYYFALGIVALELLIT